MRKIILLLLLAMVGVLQGAETVEFTNVSPFSIGSAKLNAVTFGAGRFVVVGDGVILFSEDDGISWRKASGAPKTNYNALIHTGSRFFSVGEGSNIATSVDGSNWAILGLQQSHTLKSIAFGAGATVAVGDGIVASNKNLSWTTVYDGNFEAVAFGGGKFLAISKDQTGAISNDGQHWEKVANNIPLFFDNPSYRISRISGMVYANGRFIARVYYYETFSEIFGSTDGINWTRLADGSSRFTRWTGSDLTILNGRVVASGTWLGVPEGAVQSWSLDLSNELDYRAPEEFGTVAGTTSTFIGLGGGGNIWRSTNWQTLNASDWNLMSPPEVRLNSVAVLGQVFVGVGQETTGGPSGMEVARIVVSTNGLRSTFSARAPDNAVGLNAIYGADGRFVAVGRQGTIIRSFDGINWSKRVSNTTNEFSDVTYGAGTWVAVGTNGRIVSSSDGSAFSLRFSTTELDLKGVAFGGGQFVAVGSNGAILVSPNGLDWMSAADEAIDLSAVAYGNGRYVATGTNEIVRVSVSGADWQTYRIPGAFLLSHVAFANGVFVAIGVRGPSSGGSISPKIFYYSFDGVNWQNGAVTEAGIVGIESTGDEIWLSGQKSTIWKTLRNPVSMAQLQLQFLDRSLVFSVYVPIAGDYSIESALTLPATSWQNVVTFSNIFQHAGIHLTPPAIPAAYYRMRRR